MHFDLSMAYQGEGCAANEPEFVPSHTRRRLRASAEQRWQLRIWLQLTRGECREGGGGGGEAIHTRCLLIFITQDLGSVV